MKIQLSGRNIGATLYSTDRSAFAARRAPDLWRYAASPMSTPLKARSLARRIVAWVLDRVPLSLLLWMRPAYANAPPTSLRRRVLGGVLEVVRHRSIGSIGSFHLIDNTAIQLVEADSLVIRRLFWFGEQGYEQSEAGWWRYFCARSNHILELGANIGYYSVQGALAAPEASYVAVEPHPGVANILRANLRLNGLQNVGVREAAAVGKKSADTMQLLVPDEDHYAAPCGASLGGDGEGFDRAASASVSVAVVEASSLVGNVDLIKLDIEGYEFQILSSVADSILGNRPTLFVEMWDEAPKLRAFLIKLCTEAEYRPYAITSPTLEPISIADLASISLLGRFGNRDLILTTQVMDGVALPRAS
jgi:FkbM family methyltransferase